GVRGQRDSERGGQREPITPSLPRSVSPSPTNRRAATDDFGLPGPGRDPQLRGGNRPVALRRLRRMRGALHRGRAHAASGVRGDPLSPRLAGGGGGAPGGTAAEAASVSWNGRARPGKAGRAGRGRLLYGLP